MISLILVNEEAYISYNLIIVFINIKKKIVPVKSSFLWDKNIGNSEKLVVLM